MRVQRATILSVACSVSLVIGSSAPHLGVRGGMAVEPADPARVALAYADLPLSFQPNLGQTDARVDFLARGRGYTVFLTPDEAILSLMPPFEPSRDARNEPASRPSDVPPDPGAVIGIRVRGAGPRPVARGADPLPGTVNYFVGSDPQRWQTGIPTYARVEYSAVYPGIDLVYYGTQGQLEYDFILRPGADADAISLGVTGADAVALDDAGDLVLHAGGSVVRQHRPVAYQEIGGERHPVAADYVLADDGEVRFALGAYDHDLPLVIDPVLSYATFLGGSDLDVGRGIAVNTAGEAWVAGTTSSVDFPTKLPLYGDKPTSDAFVTKLWADGSVLIVSTYLGGAGSDSAMAIALDSSGRAYVTGSTASPDFPKTPTAFDTTCGTDGACNGAPWGDAFIVVLPAAGCCSLLYAGFIGGNNANKGGETGFGIAASPDGTAVVTGYTSAPDFPVKNALYPSLKGTEDAFLLRVDTLKSGAASLVYSTFLGGSGADQGYGVAIDKDGSAIVVGTLAAASGDFPLKNSLLTNQPGTDGFVAKVNANGSALLFSTYLGGDGTNSESTRAVATDKDGNVYVTGQTNSTNFPTSVATYDKTCGTDGSCNGSSNAYVTKLTGSGTLSYSSYLGGGAGFSRGDGIVVDHLGNAYVVGTTQDSAFPTTPNAHDKTCGSDGACNGAQGGYRDAFLAKLNSNGVALLYSTFLGGEKDEENIAIAMSTSGIAYLTGATGSPSGLPMTAGAWDLSFNGGTFDGFVAKLDLTADLAVTKQATAGPVPAGGTIAYSLEVTNTGPLAATGILLNDVPKGFPEGQVFFEIVKVSNNPAQGICTISPDKLKVFCGLGMLQSGGSTAVNIVAKVMQVNKAPNPHILNEVTVEAKEPDPVSSNNKASAKTAVTP